MSRIINSDRVARLILEEQLIHFESFTPLFDMVDNHHVRVAKKGVIDFNPRDYDLLDGLKQGSFATLRTLFTLNMPENIGGVIATNSWAAQLGLDVSGSSIFVDPGFSGTIVLEITNRMHVPFRMLKDKYIAKLVLENCDNSYDGSKGNTDDRP